MPQEILLDPKDSLSCRILPYLHTSLFSSKRHHVSNKALSRTVPMSQIDCTAAVLHNYNFNHNRIHFHAVLLFFHFIFLPSHFLYLFLLPFQKPSHSPYCFYFRQRKMGKNK